MPDDTPASPASSEDIARVVDLLAQILAQLRALNDNVVQLGERLSAGQ
jgi:hypothetical protein